MSTLIGASYRYKLSLHNAMESVGVSTTARHEASFWKVSVP